MASEKKTRPKTTPPESHNTAKNVPPANRRRSVKGSRRAKDRKPSKGRQTAKARAPKMVMEKNCTPDAVLAQFLTDLATNREGILMRFRDDRDKTMITEGLSKEAQDAIKDGIEADLLRLICVSQQNT